MIINFKIVMFSTFDYGARLLTPKINREYCKRHGYAFAFEQYDHFPLTATHEKVRVVHRHLQSADYVMWIDADAAVIDFSQTLEQFCEGQPDLVIAGHQFGYDLQGRRVEYLLNGVSCGLNGGVFMLRSSDWTYEFMDAWWNRCVEGESRQAAFHEQGQLQQMLLENVHGIQSRTNIVTPCSRLNRCDDYGRDVCDFILHLWGTSTEHRHDVFTSILNGQRPSLSVEMPTFDVPYPLD